ncbi:hypothetical protein ACFS07_01215 [Undibacterium arcticum]
MHGDDVVMEMTRKAGYTGPLEMGYDRMIIEVGSSVRVFQPAVTFNLPDLDKKRTLRKLIGLSDAKQYVHLVRCKRQMCGYTGVQEL